MERSPKNKIKWIKDNEEDENVVKNLHMAKNNLPVGISSIAVMSLTKNQRHNFFNHRCHYQKEALFKKLEDHLDEKEKYE